MRQNILCHIETPFPEKFGVPRQPLLVTEAWGKMVFPKDDFFSEAFRGIENFTHLWLIFEFHHISEVAFNALVRPPRYSGKKKWGVFATRSPHRPNRLGLSVVKFDHLEVSEKNITLWVSGVDLVNGTPILDIKPYLPYVDAIPGARALDFEAPPDFREVVWLCPHPDEHAELIQRVISLDPRPGHNKTEEEFGVSLAGFNVKFRAEDNKLLILAVTKSL